MSAKDAHIEIAAAICVQRANAPAALIEILHEIHAALGHIPEPTLPTIAKHLNIARAEVHGVLSFYHDFRTEPPPSIVVKLCRAEACQAMGVGAVANEVDAMISGDKRATIQPVYCLGLCALAPAAMVNGKLVGRLTTARLLAAVQEAEA